MGTENVFRKGQVDQLPVITPGRPVQEGSYRQQFFVELDKMNILEYLVVLPEDRDKAVAYCHQKNVIEPQKRFVVITKKNGAAQIFRKF